MPDRGVSAIRVVGLNDFRRALAAVDPSLTRQLSAANLQAGQIVADEARRRAPTGPHQGGGRITSIAASISAGRQQRRAIIAMGGARTPHAEVYEFGGTLPRHRSSARTQVRQRPFLYPAISATRAQVLDTYDRLVGLVMSRAFPH